MQDLERKMKSSWQREMEPGSGKESYDDDFEEDGRYLSTSASCWCSCTVSCS